MTGLLDSAYGVVGTLLVVIGGGFVIALIGAGAAAAASGKLRGHRQGKPGPRRDRWPFS